MTSPLSTIDDLMRHKIDRDAAEVKLRTLQLLKNEKKFAKVIAAFFNKLPLVLSDEDFNELSIPFGFVRRS